MPIRMFHLFFVVLFVCRMNFALKAAEPVSIRGTITATEGPLEGAYVGAHRNQTTVRNM